MDSTTKNYRMRYGNTPDLNRKARIYERIDLFHHFLEEDGFFSRSRTCGWRVVKCCCPLDWIALQVKLPLLLFGYIGLWSVGWLRKRAPQLTSAPNLKWRKNERKRERRPSSFYDTVDLCVSSTRTHGLLLSFQSRFTSTFPHILYFISIRFRREWTSHSRGMAPFGSLSMIGGHPLASPRTRLIWCRLDVEKSSGKKRG